MIPIDRARLVDDREIHPGEAWQRDAEEATEAAIRERADHDVKKGIYAHDRVRQALEELTHFKCAYCEILLIRFDWDVEHFRPKGRVKERKDHPGYYWLAYQWDNLLPSCTYCNQNRKERPLFVDPRPGETGGKLDQFPVADEAERAMSHRDEVSRETPLLIDPSKVDPAEHLAFDPTGRVLAINDSQMGEASIRVFRLNLRRLRRARREVLLKLEQLVRLRDAARERGEEETAQLADDILQSLAADSEQFAGMTRFFLANPEALGIAS